MNKRNKYTMTLFSQLVFKRK